MVYIVESVKFKIINKYPFSQIRLLDVLIHRKIFHNTFTLGTKEYLTYDRANDISFIINEAETSEDTFKWTEGNEIMVTNKETQQSEILSPALLSRKMPTFKASYFTEVILPESIYVKKVPFFPKEIEEELMKLINNPNFFEIIFLYGSRGSKKASFLKDVEGSLPKRHFLWIDQIKLMSQEKYLEKVFDNVIDLESDVIICIPDFDSLYDKSKDSVTALSIFLKNLSEIPDSNIKVVITCRDVNKVQKIQFHLESDTQYLFVRNPNESEKIDFLKRRLPTKMLERIHAEEGLNILVKLMKGFSTQDMYNFETKLCCYDEEDGDYAVTLDTVRKGRLNKIYKPIFSFNMIADLENLRWSDIGGYEEVKTILHEDVQGPLSEGHIISRGVLFYGPPGCSKTMFARALATECNMNLFMVQPSNIMKGLLGESEARLRQIILHATASAPSIIFIDEIDKLIPRRQPGTTVSTRLLSELLQFLDGASSDKNDNVLLLGATNIPDNLDEALLRPGRFDLKIKIGLPDLTSRESILRLVFSDETFSISEVIRESMRDIALKLENKSGADIIKIGKMMKKIARKEFMESGNSVKDVAPLTMEHVYKSLACFEELSILKTSFQ